MRLVAHGAGLELFLDETAIRFPNLAIIELAEKVARPGKEEERLPWIWMSVSDTIKEVRRLRAVLKSSTGRDGRDALNAERYVARLEALRDRMKGAFDPFRKLRVVALDGASARFAREARLEVVTAASPDEAIAVVKQTNARLVLVDLRLREEGAPDRPRDAPSGMRHRSALGRARPPRRVPPDHGGESEVAPQRPPAGHAPLPQPPRPRVLIPPLGSGPYLLV